MESFISNYANIPNPITKFFNKLDYVSLEGNYYKEDIEWLESMKKVPLYVNFIKIYPDNAEELENLTDPNLHNTPISNLELELNRIKISSKTIENLKAIYPNSITLSDDSEEKDESTNQTLFRNFTKLLSKLDRTSLEMYFWNIDYRFELEFRDVIFKVVESKEECSYIRAKLVKISCEYEEFCWIK